MATLAILTPGLAPFGISLGAYWAIEGDKLKNAMNDGVDNFFDQFEVIKTENGSYCFFQGEQIGGEINLPNGTKATDIYLGYTPEQIRDNCKALMASEKNSLDSIMAAKAQASNAGKLYCDPIAIDMDGDGVETLSQTDGAYFDLDKNGFAEKTGWIKGDDALLVRDLNGDDKINDGGELFGDQTVLSTGVKATTGFEALAELDSNKDGFFTTEDTEFSKLKIWKDTDADGVTDEGELTSLTEAGIKSISLNSQTVTADDGKGNKITRNSNVEFEDGRVNTVSEFLFDRNTIDTISSSQQVIADDIKILPFMRGFGNSADLHTAMAQDDTLK